MKTITIATIVGIITFISLYAASSFAYMDLNCLHWHGVIRGIILFSFFYTKEQRNSFYENNEQLVKDYLMIE